MTIIHRPENFAQMKGKIIQLREWNYASAFVKH